MCVVHLSSMYVHILDILYSVCNTMYIVYVYFLLHILILLFAVCVE